MSFAVGQARPLRWLVVAPFSVPPSGRHTPASGERFKTLMKKIGPKATVPLPTELGRAVQGSVSLEFTRPRDFRLAEVIKRVDVLGKLSTIADELDKGGSLDAAMAKLRSTVGEGPLLDAVERLRKGETIDAPEPSAPPPAPSAPAPAAAPAPASSSGADTSRTEGGSALDAIFGKAEIAPPPREDAATVAKSSIDAFIGAMRGSSSRPGSTKAKPAAREIATYLRRIVESAAAGMMVQPRVATLESSWRGLHMLVAASPGADELAIDLLDNDETELVSRLSQRLDVPPMERPDAVFVALWIDDLATLGALAELGARAGVPIVVEADPELSGASVEAVAPGEELGDEPEGWAALRGRPEAQWLCATTNGVVLVNEEIGEFQRTVFGTSVLAVAAMLSSSVRETGGPGQIFGRAGALVAPGSYKTTGSRTAYLTTERFASVDEQRALARRGVLALGGERDSDRLRLAAAPTVRMGREDPGLPGRIIAGRAARFTRAIRDELPPGATQREVAARLAEASGSFLPRGGGAVALEVRTDADGNIGVDASIGAGLAGASFKFSSDL